MTQFEVPICTFEGKCECLKLNEKGELIDTPALEDCIYCSSLSWTTDLCDPQRIDVTTEDMRKVRKNRKCP